jgi:hypothetical protein
VDRPGEQPGGDGSDRIKGLLSGKIDWEALWLLLEHHGVAPLFYSGLNSTFPTMAPAEVLARLRESYINNAARSLFLTGKLLLLVEQFQARKIPAIPLKGPVLAECLYGNAGLRQFADLDILVAQRDLAAATQLLRDEGYSLSSELAWASEETIIDLNFELVFTRKCGTHVDLHWEIAFSDYPFRFDTQILWSSLESVRIGGREVPTLSAECQLLFLCVHGAKHLWTRLQWICDLARLLQSVPEMNWTVVAEHAARFGCEHVVHLGLCLAHNLLQAPIPPAVWQQVQADRVIPPLVVQIQEGLFRVPPVPTESLELVVFNAKLTKSRWLKIRHFAALLKAPTEADAKLLRLPRKLFFLYYPFRLWRLLIKYGFRLLHRR